MEEKDTLNGKCIMQSAENGETETKDKPVVLGEWMYDDSCSECGKWANWNYKFCPNCGVKMKNPEKGR